MLRKIKKGIQEALLLFERLIIIPFKIKFISIKCATLEEVIYETNTHGFTSCVLFCHYNKHGLILQQVKELCLFFQSQGIDVIFLTTKVSDESREWVEKNLSGLLVRKNFGRDFGAWKDGIAFLNNKSLFSECSQLYLINDSLLLLGHNLTNSQFQSKFIYDTDTDVIGLTESWQQAYHLQSYFLKFNKGVIHSEIFCDYWLSYPLINSRLFSIENGEIGLSQIMLKNGYNLKAIYPILELLKKDNIELFFSIFDVLSIPMLSDLKKNLLDEFFEINFTDMNTSHRLWPLLLVIGCPVLKRDLIEKNPENLISMQYFMYLVEKYITNLKEKEVFLQSISHIKYQKKF
jgi:hypothetical protein